MIELKNINIQYDNMLLQQDYICFYPNQITLIEGESGCGKTSLLYRLALMTLDCDIYIDQQHINELHVNELTQIRKDQISFVLQTNDVIEHLTVYDNLELYAMMINQTMNLSIAQDLLKKFELDISLNQKISSLSLGEKKRLSIACALIKKPKILIIDEPTSALDSYNTTKIYQLLRNIVKQFACYVILTSHDEEARHYADCIYQFKNKQIICTKQGRQSNEIIQANKFIMNPLFIKKYVDLYINKFLLVHKLMIMFYIFLFSTLLINMVYSEYQMNQIEKELYNQYDNVLMITPSYNDKYLDLIKEPVQINESTLYPLYKIKIENIDSCYIVPYFHSHYIEDKINSFIGAKALDGTYLSYDTYLQLRRSVSVQDTMDLMLSVETEQKRISFPISIQINGILKKGVKQYYTSSSDCYIYMYYKDYMQMFSQHFQINDAYGYVKICQDMDEAKMVKNEIISNGYGVNDENIFFHQIDTLMNFQQNQFIQLNILIYIISFLMVTCLYLYDYLKRKKEYALLILNGISIKKILLILIYEMIRRLKYVICVSFGVILLIYLFINYDFIYIGYMFLYFIIMIIYILILYAFLLKSLKIEKVFRN